MEQQMTKSEFMKMRPPITNELLIEAKKMIEKTKFLPFVTKYALICKHDENYCKIFNLLVNNPYNKSRLIDTVIGELRKFGQIKEIDVREDDETVRFWIDDLEYALIPYETDGSDKNE